MDNLLTSVTPQNPPNPKLEKFVEELNALLKRYQYTLKSTLRYGAEGVFPALDVVDVPPEALPPVDAPIDMTEQGV